LNNKTHLVFGAGLTGGYLAGGLIAAGLSTSLVARQKTHIAMANGLLLSDYDGNQKTLPAPTFMTAGNPSKQNFDFIWLTVKCTAIANITTELASFVSESTVIICCQNGFGSDQIIRQSFPNNDVLIAIVGFNVAEPKPGHLHRSTEGRLVIQQASEAHSISSEAMPWLAEKLDSKMLPALTSEYIEAEQWAKLQLNLTNPVNALANIPLKQMLEDRGFRKIVACLMEELLTLCDAKDIKLPQINAVPGRWIPRIMKLPDFLFKLVGRKMIDIDPTARLSMWWDLSNGKATEIDFINGALVAAGKEIGLACPANEAVVKLIQEIERTETQLTVDSTQLSNIVQIRNA
jgi:2-dehydropantoate 2-reductase